MRHVGPEVQRASNHGSPAESDTTVYYNCTLCTSNLSLPQHCQAAPFHNVDKFELNFRIWTKFQNLDKISEFGQHFRIWTRIQIQTKLQNFDQDQARKFRARYSYKNFPLDFSSKHFSGNSVCRICDNYEFSTMVCRDGGDGAVLLYWLQHSFH